MIAALQSVHQKLVAWRYALIFLRVIIACARFPEADLYDQARSDARFSRYAKYYARRSELHAWLFQVFMAARLQTEQAKPEQDIKGEATVSTKSSGPPKSAEFVAGLFETYSRRDFVLGDKAEDFARNVARFDRRRAVFLYWVDTLRGLHSSVWSSSKRIAFFAILVDLYRRARGL
jgi:hypothetical protein